MALTFFRLGQTEEWFISGKMLSASNGLNATFSLFFLFSFTEISQGSENQPKHGMDSMYGLNLLFLYGVLPQCVSFFFDSFFFSFLRLLCVYLHERRSHNFPFFDSGN